LFEDNFVHADLHAGNVLVRNAKSNSDYNTSTSKPGQPQLVLLDAGLTIELLPYDRKNLIALFRAVFDNDGAEAAHLMMTKYAPSTTDTATAEANLSSSKGKISGNNGNASDSDMSSCTTSAVRPEEYKEAMAQLVNSVHAQGLSLGKIGVGAILAEVLRLSYEHDVQLESRFVSVVVSVMLAEGLGRQLDPEVDIIARAVPFLRSAAVNKLLGRTDKQ
jgi:aarF domain-containing kinase